MTASHSRNQQEYEIHKCLDKDIPILCFTQVKKSRVLSTIINNIFIYTN